MKSIGAAAASRHFSALLREVSQGARIRVTSRGKPVAIISAVDQAEPRERIASRRALLSRLRATPATAARSWTRDELHE